MFYNLLWDGQRHNNTGLIFRPNKTTCTHSTQEQLDSHIKESHYRRAPHSFSPLIFIQQWHASHVVSTGCSFSCRPNISVTLCYPNISYDSFIGLQTYPLLLC